MCCGIGHRQDSDPKLLWLWCRPAATAPIRPLAWEPPFALGAALEKAKRQKINKQTNKQKTKKNKTETKTRKQAAKEVFVTYFIEIFAGTEAEVCF